MSPRVSAVAALAAGAALLVLPPAGTESRERGFCRPWLALTRPEKVEVLGAEDRPGLREMLDAECRNWPALMDFEVRAIVDRRPRPESRAPAAVPSRRSAAHGRHRDA